MAGMGDFITKTIIGHQLGNKFAAKKDERKKLAEALAAARMIGYMQQMAQELPSGEGLGAYTTGAGQWLKRRLKRPGHDQQTSYDNMRKGLVAGKIGTGIAEEQRLTDEDILRYVQLIPTKWSSQSEENTGYGDILGQLGALAGESQPQVESAWGSGQKAYLLKKALEQKMLKGGFHD